MADSTTHLDQLSTSTANNELRVNETADALSGASMYGRRASTTTGLTWGYYGGRLGGSTVANGTVTLTNGTNYVVASRSTGAVSTSTSTTNWNATNDYARLYKIVAASSQVSSYEDHRLGRLGILSTTVRGRRVNSQSAAYTLVDADSDAFILHPSADTTARVFTIPANSSVPWPVGTEIEIINQNSAGTITISITTDTMRLAGAGTTGSRTLAANGWARAKKITGTEWIIRGEGLT